MDEALRQRWLKCWASGGNIDADMYTTVSPYYRARYYDPSAGRWLSEDPLEFDTDTNFYRYVGNGPIGSVDPFGLAAAPATMPTPPKPVAVPTSPASPSLLNGLEPFAIATLAYYEIQLGGALLNTVEAINAENQTYVEQMQAEGRLNQLLLQKANERQCEHDNYKKRCNQSPPPGLGPCEKKIWELQRNIECRDMRYAWDQKWQPGRHDIDLLQLTKGIQNQQTWIENNCK